MTPTLNEVKNYLHVYDDYDDIFINSLIEIVDIYVEKTVGSNYLNNVKLVKLAKILKLKYIEDLYDNHSTEISNNTKQDKMVTTINQVLDSCGVSPNV